MRARDTGGAALPNLYLHPLVAEQKRHVHLELARRWTVAWRLGRVAAIKQERAGARSALLPQPQGLADRGIAGNTPQEGTGVPPVCR